MFADALEILVVSGACNDCNKKQPEQAEEETQRTRHKSKKSKTTTQSCDRTLRQWWVEKAKLAKVMLCLMWSPQQIWSRHKSDPKYSAVLRHVHHVLQLWSMLIYDRCSVAVAVSWFQHTALNVPKKWDVICNLSILQRFLEACLRAILLNK